MPLTITVKVTGVPETTKRLQSLGRQFNDFSGAMRQIGESLAAYYAGQVFASQGGVFDEPWQSLTPLYARRKAKLFPGKSILEATGTMRRSFAYGSDANSATIYNTDPKFPWHQLGTSRGLPARPMFAINNDVNSIIQKIIQVDVQKKLEVSNG